jgi:hypothetical protein
MKNATLGQKKKILTLLKDVPREQVQALLMSGLLADLCNANVSEIDRKEFRKLIGLGPLNPPFLEKVGEITIPAQTSFCMGDFMEECSKRDCLKIAWLGIKFKKLFYTKIEEPIQEEKLCYFRTRRISTNKEIVAELGDKKETKLVQLCVLLKLQGNREKGALLTESINAPNIFYIRDVNGMLNTVQVGWDLRGWGNSRCQIRSQTLPSCRGKSFFPNLVSLY